ncbi:hypothetical protein GQ457_07G035540 [Hibiscus cannabinus]
MDVEAYLRRRYESQIAEIEVVEKEDLDFVTANRTSSLDGSLCTPSITITAAKSFEAHTVKYLKDQVSSYFTEKLLGIVRDFVLHMKGLCGSGKVDQQRAHKAPHKGDAALEFIKHVCAVLALDYSVQHDVLVLRKNLLKYAHIKEFAPEAEFHDPCPFILPNVICKYTTAMIVETWIYAGTRLYWLMSGACAVPSVGSGSTGR